MKLKATGIAHTVSAAAIHVLTLPLSPQARAYVHALLAEDLKPYAEKQWPHTSIQYFAPGWRPFKRASEGKADMIGWIDSFPKNAVFWDVGSNVGVYSLYAASKEIRTIAFEPEASSFYLLEKNIDLNGLHGKVIAFNIALSDRTGTAGFQLSNVAIGTPRHQVTEFVRPSNELPCRVIAAMTGRDLIDVFKVPAPTHVNIDVDGNELSVLRGLPLDRLSEIRCEMRRNGAAPKIAALLEAAGFDTEGCVERVEASRKMVNIVLKRRAKAAARAVSEAVQQRA